MGTYYMGFPFLTCEVKSGGSATLDISPQQAHRASWDRGAFRLVDWVKELNRRVHAFLVSHDHETVRIYGHYPVIEGNKTTYWRYPIRKYDFTEREGLERWTAYEFTKNVYDLWMPQLFGLILSAVDLLSPVPGGGRRVSTRRFRVNWTLATIWPAGTEVMLVRCLNRSRQTLLLK